VRFRQLQHALLRGVKLAWLSMWFLIYKAIQVVHVSTACMQAGYSLKFQSSFFDKTGLNSRNKKGTEPISDAWPLLDLYPRLIYTHDYKVKV
jgi:hypothetical protein